MRRRHLLSMLLLPLLLWLLLATTTTQEAAAAFTPVPEMLDKDDVLWVRLKGCQLDSKMMRRGESPCGPIGAGAATSELPGDDCKRMLGVLFPSLKDAEKPKVLVARVVLPNTHAHSNAAHIDYAIVDVPLPSPATAPVDLRKLDDAHFKPFDGGTRHWKLLDKPEHLVAILYDHTSNELYILFQKDDKVLCDVYVMGFVGEASGQPRAHYLHSFDADYSVFSGTQWSTDTYDKKFYYQRWEKSESGDVELVLRGIPFPELMQSLREGRQGSYVFHLKPPTGTSLKVTDGVVHGSVPGTGSFYADPPMHYFCPDDEGADCAFAITGREFCKLKVDSVKSLQACEEEASARQQGWTDKLSCPYFVALAVVGVLLAMALILCCVKCLISRKHQKQRKKFKAANRAPLNPDYVDSFMTL